jgi:hypothetical protein
MSRNVQMPSRPVRGYMAFSIPTVPLGSRRDSERSIEAPASRLLVGSQCKLEHFFANMAADRMSASEWSRLSSLFDKEMRRRKVEAGGRSEKYGAARQAEEEARSLEKGFLDVDSEGMGIFLKGGQNRLLRHEAEVLSDLESAVRGTQEASFFNFPIRSGMIKDGHFLMAFRRVGKPLTLSHFIDPTVVGTVIQLLDVLRRHGFAQGDLKPDAFRYYYRQG